MQYSLEALYEYFLGSTGVSTDTRHIAKDNIFFALKGPNFNGNRYANMALEKGASLVVVDEAEAVTSPKHFLVEDGLSALQNLAKRHRKSFDKPVIGITGSNGKTTTKELLNAVLSTQYNVLFTQGNLNNHIGVPLTLLKLDLLQHDIAIIEMGANKVGDIKELCDIALPTHGLITNIGTAHIGGFGGKEGIIRGKSELFDHIKRHNGLAFINDEDEVLANMSKRFEDAHHYPASEQIVPSDTYLSYAIEGKTYKTQLTGEYNFINICAALSVGRCFDVASEKGSQAIETYVPTNNRSQIFGKGTNTLILDAYNANPDSMKAALDNFHAMKSQKKAVILGDMKELGSFSQTEHAKIGAMLSIIKPDASFFVGEDMKHAYEAYDGGSYFENITALTEYFKNVKFDNYLILIKGSRSMSLESICASI